MGVHKYTHIGVYIKAKNIEEVRTIYATGCTNTECKNFQFNSSAYFCSECGKEIKGLSKIVTRKVTWYDIADKNNFSCDAVCDINTNEEFMILIPNEQKYIPKNWEKPKLYDDALYIEDFSPEYITKDLETFKELARPILYLLRKECGEENVSIHWGILQYYN